MKAARSRNRETGAPREGLSRKAYLSEVSDRLKIANPVRLSILLTLAEGGRSAGELGAAIEQSPSAISHHLALLRHGDFVFPRRQGKQHLYTLTDRGRWMVNLVRTLVDGERPQGRADPTTIPIDRSLLEDVAGFVDDPEQWFRTPNAEFEWRRPIELLGTPDETRLRDSIEAAKLGMFS